MALKRNWHHHSYGLLHTILNVHFILLPQHTYGCVTRAFVICIPDIAATCLISSVVLRTNLGSGTDNRRATDKGDRGPHIFQTPSSTWKMPTDAFSTALAQEVLNPVVVACNCHSLLPYIGAARRPSLVRCGCHALLYAAVRHTAVTAWPSPLAVWSHDVSIQRCSTSVVLLLGGWFLARSLQTSRLCAFGDRAGCCGQASCASCIKPTFTSQMYSVDPLVHAAHLHSRRGLC